MTGKVGSNYTSKLFRVLVGFLQVSPASKSIALNEELMLLLSKEP